jgi:hypothetical protein
MLAQRLSLLVQLSTALLILLLLLQKSLQLHTVANQVVCSVG